MPAFLEGLVAGYGIAIPVGAISVLIVNTSIRCGLFVGFLAGAGAATADLFYAILASAAGAALVVLLEPIATALRLASAAVLIGIALYGLRQGLARRHRASGTAGACNGSRTFAQFVGLTLINPLTVVYFTAFILGRERGLTATLAAHVLFIAGVALASLSWQSLLAGLGGVARYRLSPRFQVAAVLLGNAIILALGVRILVLAQAG